jgi:hypothetical protein
MAPGALDALMHVDRDGWYDEMEAVAIPGRLRRPRARTRSSQSSSASAAALGKP